MWYKKNLALNATCRQDFDDAEYVKNSITKIKKIMGERSIASKKIDFTNRNWFCRASQRSSVVSIYAG